MRRVPLAEAEGLCAFILRWMRGGAGRVLAICFSTLATGKTRMMEHGAFRERGNLTAIDCVS
jgi:hypothetical protein